MLSSAYLTYAILVILYLSGAQSYEWSCSPLDTNSNHYTLPGLDYGDVQNVTSDRFRRGFPDVSIFPVPSSLNCSGTVSALRFCYTGLETLVSFETRLQVFTLMILEQAGFTFETIKLINVSSTPTAQICTDGNMIIGQSHRICCDTMELDAANQFNLPKPGFAFGVVATTDIRGLRYRANVSQELVDLFRTNTSDIGSISLGRSFTVASSSILSDPLRLFQFIVTQPGAPEVTEAPSTAKPTTTSSSSGRGQAIGASLGVIGSILVLVAITVVVILLLIHYRSLGRKNPDRGTENPTYEADDGVTGTKYTQKETERNKSQFSVPGEHAYSYTSTGPTVSRNSNLNLSNVYEPVNHENKVFSEVDESIYMAPGSDETTLYYQLEDIMLDAVQRKALKLGDILGSGQFGTVYKGVWQSKEKGTMEVAVKTLNEGSTEKDKIKFLQEAAIMSQFKHPNVVEMHGVITDKEPILLVIELLKKGDLREYLIKMRLIDDKVSVAADDHTLLSYCHQVASGMAYLSSKAFVHRDLAARNVLVSEDNTCKIADFGMSRDLMDENYYVSHGGKIPVKWTAPEALHYKKYSTASDVWSYGALMYEIWSLGHKPYENLTASQFMKKVDTGYRLAPPPGCPRALYSIMIQCWHPMTSKRPSFQDIARELRSRPEVELLKWMEEDRQTHPDADKLGADLDNAQNLYTDLQLLYIKS